VIDSLSPGSYRLQYLSFDRLPSVGMADIKLQEGTDLDLELKPVEAAAITGKVNCDCKTPLAESDRLIKILFEPLRDRLVPVQPGK
jgi:hypothetical protein